MNSIEEFNATKRIDLAPARISSIGDPLEKPLVSRYSIIHQIVVYPFVGIALMFMFQSFGDWFAFGFFTICFLLFMIPVWFVSAVVRVDGAGMTMSRLFGIVRREIEWTEIESVKPGRMGVGIKVQTADARSMAISSQMSKYPVLIDILRISRPDLFALPGVSSASRTFRKTFFRKSWLLFLSVAMTVVFLASIPTIVPAIIMGIVILLMWNAALSAVHTVTLEENRLSTRSLWARREITSQQIKDIRMASYYNRKGVATRLTQIELLDGTNIVLSDFPEGNEIMYGFLKSWWSAYQTV
ncbi:MAG TPA: hypothetical protein VFY25_15770 [Anaerolineales bacterium]|nr:hypothetical protein [Anaerolineales bacterium]